LSGKGQSELKLSGKGTSVSPWKKDAEANPAELVNTEKLRHAEVEVVALQQQLDVKAHEAAAARRAERDWRGKADAFDGQMTQQRSDTLDITADMSRQYGVGWCRRG